MPRADRSRISPRSILHIPGRREGSFPGFVFSATFFIAGTALDIKSNDEAVLQEIANVIGGDDGPALTRLSFLIESSSEDWGTITAQTDDPIVFTTEDLALGAAIGSADFPFRTIDPSEEGWTAFAWREDGASLFEFRNNVCRFWKRDGWRRAVAILLLHCIYRVRRDAIFFHAATVSLDGAGVMFIGPKGAGKSTSSLALAARGHALLGDETASYLPASGEVEPFLRPIGIKPGPRSRTIAQALLRVRTTGSEDEVVRMSPRAFLDTPIPKPVPLRSIIFLEPFADSPRVVETEPSRQDLALLQPVTSSFVNAPRSQRTLELVRMLSRCRTFRLSPSDPDETACLVESHLGGLGS